MCSLILVYLFLLQNHLTAILGIQQTKIMNSKYKCGKNEVYKRSQICEGFCDENALECGTSKKNVFVTGCFCKNGYLKDKQSRCVSKRRCFVPNRNVTTDTNESASKPVLTRLPKQCQVENTEFKQCSGCIFKHSPSCEDMKPMCSYLQCVYNFWPYCRNLVIFEVF